MRHLNDLILDVRSLCTACHLNCQLRSANQNVAYANLAAAVRLTMITSETLYHHAGKCSLAIQENHVVRDKYAVENNQNFVSAVLLVANVNVIVFLGLAGVAGLTAQNQRDAFCIGRARKGNGIVLIAFAHGNGRHNQNIMAVQVTGLMCLCTGDIYTVRRALYHVQEQIRICLLRRRQTAVALNVGHCAVNRQVLILNHRPELLEVLVVLGAACFIGFIGGGVHSICCVHADTALETSCGLLTKQTLHLYLLNQVIGGLMQMGKTVYLVAGQVGGCSHQIFILRILCQLIGCCERIQGRTNNRIVYHVFYSLAEAIQLQMQLAQRFDVLFFGHHNRFLLSALYYFLCFTLPAFRRSALHTLLPALHGISDVQWQSDALRVHAVSVRAAVQRRIPSRCN